MHSFLHWWSELCQISELSDLCTAVLSNLFPHNYKSDPRPIETRKIPNEVKMSRAFFSPSARLYFHVGSAISKYCLQVCLFVFFLWRYCLIFFYRIFKKMLERISVIYFAKENMLWSTFCTFTTNRLLKHSSWLQQANLMSNFIFIWSLSLLKTTFVSQYFYEDTIPGSSLHETEKSPVFQP